MELPPVIKNCYRKVRYSYRRTTSTLRPLPDFLVIGAMKCGTSSLWRYLSYHPQIKTSFSKELHYFDRKHKKGVHWYRSQFPLSFFRVRYKITGEASPSYVLQPHVADKIFELVPKVKLICLLRNPTDRAISHYFHTVRKGREQLPILKAMQAEESRIDREWNKMLGDPYYYSRVCNFFSYKKRGLYLEQLERFRLRFPEKQLLVLDSTSFFEKTAETLSRVFQFLEIEPYDRQHIYRPENIGSNKKKVDSAVYEYLDGYFAPYNRKFFEVTGYDFDWKERC